MVRTALGGRLPWGRRKGWGGRGVGPWGGGCRVPASAGPGGGGPGPSNSFLETPARNALDREQPEASELSDAKQEDNITLCI